MIMFILAVQVRQSHAPPPSYLAWAPKPGLKASITQKNPQQSQHDNQRPDL